VSEQVLSDTSAQLLGYTVTLINVVSRWKIQDWRQIKNRHCKN